MLEFEEFRILKANSIGAREAFVRSKEQGLSRIDAIRMLRKIYDLSLIDAQRIIYEVEVGRSPDVSTPELASGFLDILDELLEKSERSGGESGDA